MRHRADIDGLRAVAVLPVVAYHAQMFGVSGGFIGVDVFFVISGYLITAILMREMEQGRFSIIRFYERRIRRIFPALFAVIAATAIAAAFLLLPEDLEEFGRSVIATAFFVSNIFFWNETDYFDSAANLKPLLHTWSLAVEEQFYILFPIVMFVCLWIGRGSFVLLRIVVGFACIGSFLLSLWAVANTPVAAFYWAPTRAWELMLGAALSVGLIPNIASAFLRDALAWCGLALILGSCLWLTDTIPFPGLFAAPACLGTAFLLHVNSDRPTLVGRCLALRPMAFIGLISYSLYLWHWPVLVFVRYVHVEPLDWDVTTLAVLSSFALATFSWWCVERPFRKAASSDSTRHAVSGGVVAMLGASAAGAFLYLTNGLDVRMPASVLAVLDPRQFSDSGRGDCHMVYARRAEELCVRGANGVAPSFILVGDSHAGALAAAVFEAAAAEGVAGYQLSDAGWSPVIGYEKWGERAKFAYMNQRLVETLDRNPNLKTIAIVVYWRQAVLVNRYYASDGSLLSGTDGVLEGISALARRYPDRTFLTMDAPPSSPLFGYHAAARAIYFGYSFTPTITRVDLARDRAGYDYVLASLDALPNVTRLDPAPYLCDERRCPGAGPEGLLYRDDNHLSLAGARRLESMYESYWHGHIE